MFYTFWIDALELYCLIKHEYVYLKHQNKRLIYPDLDSAHKVVDLKAWLQGWIYNVYSLSSPFIKKSCSAEQDFKVPNVFFFAARLLVVLLDLLLYSANL